MNNKELEDLLRNLIQSPKENEWIEFKHNFHSKEEIGETISALANGAALNHQPYGYLIFGIENKTHNVVGTSFHPKSYKVGSEEIENWLCQRLNPRIDFKLYEFEYEGKQISLFQVPSSENQPVDFLHVSYIRIGSYVRILRDFPEKERKIWSKIRHSQFEKEIALKNLSPSDIINFLDTQCYFDLMHLPYPSTRDLVLEKFISEKLVLVQNNNYSITNLGGLLFAKNLNTFPDLARKVVRVINYKGTNKLETLKDSIGTKGYAIGFQGLVSYINDQLPQNEEISKALRKKVRMYPEESIRELVANALIHQDLSEKGNPVIEIYSDRIEFSNPGLPIITPIRFIDEYQSRNESLADMMRRLGMCEEKGSGIDRVIFQSEVFQLPAPEFLAQEKHTKVIMFSHLTLNQMDKTDKIRACYQHACLSYVSNTKMTNQSLRQRFKIAEKNSAIASRIIHETIEEGLIKEDDPNSKSRKFAKYIPFWA
jgi:predicted HTH transcriptional regulator